MPLWTAAAIAGGAALAGSAVAAHGAGSAASTESNAALQAAQLQHDSSQQALNFQKQQYNTTQSELAPFLQSGQSATANLDYLLGIGPNPTAPPSSTTGTPGVPATMSGTNPTTGTILPPTAPRPGAPVLTNPGAKVQSAGQFGDVLTAGQGITGASPSGAPGAIPPGYAGQSFNSLTQSGDPNVSPNQQTTQQWKAQGIPFQNITTSDGRTVSVRTDQAGPQASAAPPTGIQPSSSALVNPDLGAYGSLSKGWDQTFQAPNQLTEQNDPGFQARLNLGETALNNSAAAKGNLLTGGTARDVNQFAQDYASNEYGNVYNRAMNTFDTNYNTFSADQTSKYNRLASLAGVGQQTASQLGTLGQNNANNTGNLLIAGGNAQASGINNAAAATASGYQNQGNIYGSALSGIGGQAAGLAQLYALLNQQNQQNQNGPYSTNVGSQTSS